MELASKNWTLNTIFENFKVTSRTASKIQHFTARYTNRKTSPKPFKIFFTKLFFRKYFKPTHMLQLHHELTYPSIIVFQHQYRETFIFFLPLDHSLNVYANIRKEFSRVLQHKKYIWKRLKVFDAFHEKYWIILTEFFMNSSITLRENIFHPSHFSFLLYRRQRIDGFACVFGRIPIPFHFGYWYVSLSAWNNCKLTQL